MLPLSIPGVLPSGLMMLSSTASSTLACTLCLCPPSVRSEANVDALLMSHSSRPNTPTSTTLLGGTERPIPCDPLMDSEVVLRLSSTRKSRTWRSSEPTTINLFP
uniref:T. congolense-specific, cell surface-expressed gene family n=1 Tax=Trypanosoma congolense (strain IL3000) TaxID=1068625 RepID=G0USS9_TRYCI|nr:hypothetical protein, unlikely [Trypanosoma congolense IL3000]